MKQPRRLPSSTRGLGAPALLPRVALGDRGAVEACINRYGPLVFALCRRMCRSVADAEDATQEIFVELWQSAARYDPTASSESTYVSMITRRRLIDRLRRQGRRPINESLENAPMPTTDGAMAMIEVRDEAARVRLAMAELSDEQRQVLMLAIDLGCTYPEIAERTHLPLGTVKTHARRGLMRLRDILAPAKPPAPSPADTPSRKEGPP